jgi:WD40 repeat protein
VHKLKNYIKNIAKLILKTSKSRSALSFGRYAILLIFLINNFGCNLCPTGPNGNNGNSADEVYSTLIPMNSVSPIITKISVESYAFSEIVNNGYIFSAPAQNGNFAFIRIDQAESKKILMLGNANDFSTKLLEKEGKDFSIFYPNISKTGDKIAFLGGTNQLFIWVFNQTSNASYIDKISSKVFDNVVPEFSTDGNLLGFLESENNNEIKLKIVESVNPDNVFFEKVFQNEQLIQGLDNYLSFSSINNKIVFLSQDTDYDKLKIVNYLTNEIKEIKVERANLGIKIAKISPDGKYIAVAANDGNIWVISIETGEPLFSKITNVELCNYFLYFDWNSDGTKLLAQSYNCNDDLTKGSTLYIIDLETKDDLMITKNLTLFCNNIQRAYWGN